MQKEWTRSGWSRQLKATKKQKPLQDAAKCKWLGGYFNYPNLLVSLSQSIHSIFSSLIRFLLTELLFYVFFSFLFFCRLFPIKKEQFLLNRSVCQQQLFAAVKVPEISGSWAQQVSGLHICLTAPRLGVQSISPLCAWMLSVYPLLRIL